MNKIYTPRSNVCHNSLRVVEIMLIIYCCDRTCPCGPVVKALEHHMQ